MRAALAHAVENDEFYPVYQPKIDLDTGATVGVEALARWDAAEYGPVSPTTFVPILTAADLMVQFGRDLFEKILADVPALRLRYGEAITVSINVSPVQMLSPSFCTYLDELCRRHAVDPSTVVVEITEDVFVGDVETVRRIVTCLSDRGIAVALDDFGKGFSSLYYIRHIPFKELKVDKSFIDDITDNERSRALFRSICDIAATYGHTVVAEGVEREEQITVVRDAGCTTAQGFFFAKPEALRTELVSPG